MHCKRQSKGSYMAITPIVNLFIYIEEECRGVVSRGVAYPGNLTRIHTTCSGRSTRTSNTKKERSRNNNDEKNLSLPALII